MDHSAAGLSRRGLLVAATATAGSALAVGTSTGAFATPARPTGADSATGAAESTDLLVRDRIASALTRRSDGRLTALSYTPDLHDRLTEWLRLWWANAPGHWLAPLEVRGETTADGRAFLLTGLSYTRADRRVDAFTAGTRDRAYWAVLASLHAKFPAVRTDAAGGPVQVTDGHPGFTGSAGQLAFVSDACREVWGYRSATDADWRTYLNRALRRTGQSADLAPQAGWDAFTRATIRFGLGTESY